MRSGEATYTTEWLNETSTLWHVLTACEELVLQEEEDAVVDV